MTRNLRKRHFLIWVIIALAMVMLIVIARLNIPKYAGDQVTKSLME